MINAPLGDHRSLAFRIEGVSEFLAVELVVGVLNDAHRPFLKSCVAQSRRWRPFSGAWRSQSRTNRRWRGTFALTRASRHRSAPCFRGCCCSKASMIASSPSRKLTSRPTHSASPFHLSEVRLAVPLHTDIDQIVRVNAYHPSQRGFTLRLHVAGVGGDLQKRLCSVLHTPDDYRTNIDRIADGIIDLERSTFQRLQAARDLCSWS